MNCAAMSIISKMKDTSPKTCKRMMDGTLYLLKIYQGTSNSSWKVQKNCAEMHNLYFQEVHYRPLYAQISKKFPIKINFFHTFNKLFILAVCSSECIIVCFPQITLSHSLKVSVLFPPLGMNPFSILFPGFVLLSAFK